MLATVGLVVPEFVRIPGAQFSFEAIPNVLDAHDALLDSSMKQILLWVSLAEVCTLGAISNMNEFDRPAGDYSFDPMKLYPKDPVKQKEMKLKELKNGRLVRVATCCCFFRIHYTCFWMRFPYTTILMITFSTCSFFIIINNRLWLLLVVWSWVPPLRDMDSHTYNNIKRRKSTNPFFLVEVE
jgi:hypothetical protein